MKRIVSRLGSREATVCVVGFRMSPRWKREYKQGRGQVKARIRALRRRRRIGSGILPSSMYGRGQRRSVGVFRDRRLEAPIEFYFRKTVSKFIKVVRMAHEGHSPVFFRCAIPLVVIRICKAVALDLTFMLSDGHDGVVVRETNELSMSK